MSSRSQDYVRTLGLLVVVELALSFAWLALQVEFPYHEGGPAAPGTQLVPTEPYKEIAPAVSRFMWETRGQDIALQSFVIFASVICCLAMLKEEVLEQ
jgi:hypothetical protein